jgi:hypothetical protein
LSCFEYVFTLFPHAAESGELGPAADGGWDGEGATGEVGEVWGGLGRQFWTRGGDGNCRTAQSSSRVLYYGLSWKRPPCTVQLPPKVEKSVPIAQV